MKAMEKSEWKGGVSSKALALIATHPSLSSEKHVTLVVTPTGLVPQWKQEIQQSLNCCEYRRCIYIGYNEGATGADCFHLDHYDIVFNTFRVIAVEMKADSHDQASHLACSQIQDLNSTTAQQGLMRTIMLCQMKMSTIHGRPILQLPEMRIQKVYIMFNHEQQIVYKSLQSCTWVHFYQCLDDVNDHCNVSHMLGFLGSYTNFGKLAYSFLASNAVLASGDWPRWGERHEHWTADTLQFSEVEVIRLHDHQSIWECLACTTSVENPIASTPSSHGALPGEYHSQITYPTLSTEQNIGGTAGTYVVPPHLANHRSSKSEGQSFFHERSSPCPAR